MKELFERIIGWRKKNLPATLCYNPMVEVLFLVKELSEAADEFIAGNTDKAIGEITDIIVYAVGAIELTGFSGREIEITRALDIKLTPQRVYQKILTRINDVNKKSQDVGLELFFAYAELIDICNYSIIALGYNPKIALLETVKKIESRQGAWDDSIGKWIKTATNYKPDYSKARIK